MGRKNLHGAVPLLTPPLRFKSDGVLNVFVYVFYWNSCFSWVFLSVFFEPVFRVRVSGNARLIDPCLLMSFLRTYAQHFKFESRRSLTSGCSPHSACARRRRRHVAHPLFLRPPGGGLERSRNVQQ